MEVALPITVYWDLSPETLLEDSLLKLCDEIIECRPLMLQLYDPAPQLSEGVRAILEKFRETPVAVSLTILHSRLSSDYPRDEFCVKELLVACDSTEFLRNCLPLSGVGISFYVNADNWHELPQIVTLCRDKGVNRLVLPMQRLYQGEEPFQLDRNGQYTLERALAAVGGIEGLRLTIHDPFLWRAFNPGTPFPQGGCQAANTMIAISPDGGVYPCPTLPERIGDVGTERLKEIITSPLKKGLRRKIVENPAACSNCLEVSVCRGGCRGRSRVVHGSFDEIDDACL